MPSNKHIDKILLALFGLALGFFIGIYNYTPFEFQKIVNIVINPSILITVLLAIYVTRILTPQNEKEKQEKLLLMEYFKDFQAQLHDRCGDILDLNSFDSISFNSHFKFLRTKLHSSLELAKKHNFINNNEINTNLEREITSIWEVLTDESHYNGSIKPEYKSKAEGHIIKIDELIFELISVINQH